MCSIVSVCLQTLLVNNLKTLVIKNAKFSEYYYYTNTNIWRSLTVYYYHVTYEIQSECTFYSRAECHGTPWSKQGPYLKLKWQQRDSNTH